MHNCDHQLIEMKRTPSKGKKPASVSMVCAFCGHKRTVREDGIVEITLETGRVIHEKAAFTPYS